MFRLEFEVDGRPRTQGSHVAQARRGRDGKVRLRTAPVQEDDLMHWRGAIRTAVTLAISTRTGGRIGDEPVSYPRAWPGPVLVLARFRLTLPQRLADELDPEPATVVPDGDKLERALWDALTGLAWRDDRQVIGWSGLKVYASPLERPGVSGTVLALEEDEAAHGLTVRGALLDELNRSWG